MDLIHKFHRTVYVQVLLGLFAYGVAKQSVGLALFGPMIGLLSWFVVDGGDGWAVSKWVTRMGVAATLMWCYYNGWVLGDPLILNIGTGVFCLQLLILYQRKTSRDYGQLIILSMMQMLVAMVLGASLFFGMLMAVYMVVSLMSVLRYQLRRGYDEVAVEMRKQGVLGGGVMSGGVAGPVTMFGRRCVGQFRKMALVCGVCTAGLAFVFFVALPRGEAGMLGDWERVGGAAVSGFSGDVRLNDPGRIAESDEIVMSVELLWDGEPIRGSGVQFLMRGYTLDEYDTEAERWVRSEALLRKDNLGSRHNWGSSRLKPARRTSSRLEQRVMMRIPPPNGLLFSVFMPAAARVPPRVAINTTFQSNVLTVNPVSVVSNNALEYTVWSTPGDGTMVGVNSEVMSGAWDVRSYPDDAAIEFFSGEMPIAADVLRQTAERVLSDAGVPLPPRPDDGVWVSRAARAVERHFTQNYHYSLNVPVVTEGFDVISDFLVNRDSGHCEFFATGIVGMMRSVGVPARVVTGYLVSEWNEAGGYYVVRQRNAHAWSEVWSPTEGWLTFDGSPGEELAEVHRRSEGALTWLRSRYEDLEFRWMNNVISYDSADRRTLMGDLDAGLGRLVDVEKRIRAFDGQSGNLLWSAKLPTGGHATPMTYVTRKGGRQFVVIAVGGNASFRTEAGDYVMAFALPDR